ncbi:MAG: hypothetical protein ABEJ59_03110 [Halanaeroarchaeum sp.]
MHESTATTESNWTVAYDVEPISIRDPVAEALAVLEPGDPFVVTYEDVVTAAGHSCPTASGAYRITQLGLAALYSEAYPVRGDVAVLAGGPRDDPTYGVASRLVSYITGAAEQDGFGGLAGGYGGRRELLAFGDFAGADPAFVFERTDTGEAVEVVYHASEVPGAGAASEYLPAMIDGTASEDERAAFATAWHDRVRTVLTDDELFSVEATDEGVRER